MIICISLLALASCQYSCKSDDTVTTSNPPNIPTILDEYPTWSPDGKYLAYTGGDNVNGFGILQIDTNGLNKKYLTNGYGYSPSWSPDGQWILFVDQGNIYKKRVEGDTVTVKLTSSGNNFYPAWSRDNQWISFDSNNESPNGMYFIWKMKADGSEKRRIIYQPKVGEVRNSSWFPDGIKLAVKIYIGHEGSEIGIIDTLGNLISVLTNDSQDDRTPEASPDGTKIVFNKYGNNGQTFIINSDGTNLKQIINGNSLYPTWSPDGKKIAYSNTMNGDGRIWIISIDGKYRKKITN